MSQTARTLRVLAAVQVKRNAARDFVAYSVYFRKKCAKIFNFFEFLNQFVILFSRNRKKFINF